MIDLSEINPGDQVAIRDGRNSARGEVKRSRDGLLAIEAFGTQLVFARPNARGDLQAVKGRTVFEHTPSLFAVTG